MNQACILKLGCKIINRDEDFWCNVLRSKNNCNTLDGNLTTKQHDSSMWKAVAKTHKDLLYIGVWRIGDGKSTYAWEDRCVENEKSIMDLNLPVPHALDNIKVYELMGGDSDWDWSKIDWLPTHIKWKVVAILPPDTSCDGIFSVRVQRH